MNVLFCDVSKGPMKSYNKHVHNVWEIIINLTGKNTSVIGEMKYEINTGDVIVIPPGVIHAATSSVFYSDMYVQATKLDLSGVHIIHDYDGSIKMLIKMLHKTMTEKENNYMYISDNLLECICGYIKKYLEKKYKYPFINELKNKIYVNLENTDFNISKTVRNMGYNMDYVRRCFKEEMKKTPLEYMTDLRLERASKLLLQETFVSIDDTAQKCGFNDSFYFTKMFKRNFGVPPREYKKNHSNGSLRE